MPAFAKRRSPNSTRKVLRVSWLSFAPWSARSLSAWHNVALYALASFVGNTLKATTNPHAALSPVAPDQPEAAQAIPPAADCPHPQWLSFRSAPTACRRGHSALYLRAPRLTDDLRVLQGNGGCGRWLGAVARTDVLLLDDWGLAAMDGPTRADLMEAIDDRAGTRLTIVTNQLPVEHWHAWIGDATDADAILDRLLSRSHRLNLKGKSVAFPKSSVTFAEIRNVLVLQTLRGQQHDACALRQLHPRTFRTRELGQLGFPLLAQLNNRGNWQSLSPMQTEAEHWRRTVHIRFFKNQAIHELR